MPDPLRELLAGEKPRPTTGAERSLLGILKAARPVDIRALRRRARAAEPSAAPLRPFLGWRRR